MTRERIGTIEETLQRVQGEFREMPGLRLTPAQASRLWGLMRSLRRRFSMHSSMRDSCSGPPMVRSCAGRTPK